MTRACRPLFLLTGGGLTDLSVGRAFFASVHSGSWTRGNSELYTLKSVHDCFVPRELQRVLAFTLPSEDCTSHIKHRVSRLSC
jgi:hypothetical protein